MKEPCIEVGLVCQESKMISFFGGYTHNGEIVDGDAEFNVERGKIVWNRKHYQELLIEPLQPEQGFFKLSVTIGIGFHWEQEENQSFNGSLKVIVEEDKLSFINIIPVEQYLKSVISSEMSAKASSALLKAHAVISRSWLLAQVGKRANIKGRNASEGMINTPEKIIRWYDREDHTTFDVCADDHCQRYQGITRQTSSLVEEAVEQTRGEVLLDGTEICDARFSKCCGGAFELFSSCWENKEYSYLVPGRDNDTGRLPDLRKEEESRRWITGSPSAFCNTSDKVILEKVLNQYDQSTTGFFRWKVRYTQEEIANLIRTRLGKDMGDIVDLLPVQRGVSGRLIQLKIVGTFHTLIIGKELEIRRILSDTHLYSSAFVVEAVGSGEIPEAFVLHGAGWGHGVGLCQIGAAVMSEKGYHYNAILSHYYPGATLKKLWK